MYNMYPDYSEAPKERGEGGLGHYDYPVYARRRTTAPEAAQAAEAPAAPRPPAEHATLENSLSAQVAANLMVQSSVEQG
jgi:hypothetical protein